MKEENIKNFGRLIKETKYLRNRWNGPGTYSEYYTGKLLDMKKE